ncbi:MAG: hypothetical protein A2Y24_07015 [Clostridiales bacterium GWE2_32_10]|nr:MAG: hypothetical protein A2Y24_07015 [Clostridiales bacterium GWE2_32_10]HBY19476.1 hypothetical protein [Clostridiales bacterium]
MKKLSLITKIIMIAMFLASINVYASSDMSAQLQSKIHNSVVLYVGQSKTYVNGEETMVDATNSSVTPIIKDGRTLVPVRFISESLGAKVEYNNSNKTSNISFGDDNIELTIGSKNMIYTHKSFDNVIQQYVIADSDTELDVPAQIINDRTFVPIRALVEALGKEVFWDDRGLIVISDVSNKLNSDTEKSLVDELVKEYIGLKELGLTPVEYSIKDDYLIIDGVAIYNLAVMVERDGKIVKSIAARNSVDLVKKLDDKGNYFIKTVIRGVPSHGLADYDLIYNGKDTTFIVQSFYYDGIDANVYMLKDKF